MFVVNNRLFMAYWPVMEELLQWEARGGVAMPVCMDIVYIVCGASKNTKLLRCDVF